ncbi:MAG TPA: glycosyltransferase family 2 protein [Candidatus Acidoferrum sp.]|nr:glycosyltransferase family 2 protein [Candidatus Acidoferrum sp.]
MPAQNIELAVVVPTFKERENVTLLVKALEAVLHGIEWEVIFVDDNSPDGTAEQVRSIASRDRRIRIIERVGRRGLSSACIEGMLSTPAPYIAVIDGDMQHDESVLPLMLDRIKADQLDIVVGSRKIPGGSMGEFAAGRVALSNLGSRISALVCHCEIADAMSGFFLLDRKYFQEVVRRLTGRGFKILVDLLASSNRPVRVAEVPYRFRNRQLGESKLDVNVELEYLFLVVDKVIGNYVPTRFVLFVLVGLLGVFVHLSCLGVLFRIENVNFALSQAVATWLAMTSNFLLNNVVTFRDRRLRGARFVLGLITFYLACSVGALMNVSFANYLHRASVPWYLAGAAGMAISSVWNYAANTVLTWRRSRA